MCGTFEFPVLQSRRRDDANACPSAALYADCKSCMVAQHFRKTQTISDDAYQQDTGSSCCRSARADAIRLPLDLPALRG